MTTTGVRETGVRRVALVTRWTVAAALVGAAAMSSLLARSIPGRASAPTRVSGTGSTTGQNAGSGGLLPPASVPGQSSGGSQIVSGGS